MLTGKEKRCLRSLGNEMEPTLILGKGGITENVCTQASEDLEANELIKGRVLPNLTEVPKNVAEALADRVGAELVQVIGRNFLLYRESKNKRQIEFPK